LTAAARILPEQALGRGLRRMTPPGSGFDERLVVIEHPAFRDLWSSELDGGLVVERRDADKIQPGAVPVFPDEGKREFDISIPLLSRVIARAETPLNELHVETCLRRIRPFRFQMWTLSTNTSDTAGSTSSTRRRSSVTDSTCPSQKTLLALSGGTPSRC
jgi:hypothetical protein